MPSGGAIVCKPQRDLGGLCIASKHDATHGIISRVLPDRLERWMCAWLMWSCSCAVGHGATTPGLVLLPRQAVYTYLADVVMVMHCCGCGCGAATRDLVLLPEQIEYARLADVVEPSCVAACGGVRPGCMLLLHAFFECNITNTVHEMTQGSTDTAMAEALAGPCRLDAPEDKAPAHALPDMSDAVEDDAWSGEAV